MYFSSEAPRIREWNIVVVDDDPFVLHVHSEMLKLMGHSVFPFQCPAQAQRFFESQERDVDLLITDFRMPELTGLELIERIRDSGWTIPAMILTSYINDVDADRAEAVGARVVSKPLPMHLFEKHVSSFQSG